jgi:hypothetical protein
MLVEGEGEMEKVRKVNCGGCTLHSCVNPVEIVPRREER